MVIQYPQKNISRAQSPCFFALTHVYLESHTCDLCGANKGYQRNLIYQDVLKTHC